MAYSKEYMMRAIETALHNVDNGGGPFGAVVVKDGEVISECGNRVTGSNDPTAHAEVLAIREAARKLGKYDLSDCEIYASCEPCPMCLGAIYWAHIGSVYYACTRDDAKAAGFNDSYIYNELSVEPKYRSVRMLQADSQEGLKVFKKWVDKDDRVEY
ncbi:MAG: nucleoside deaminase [Paludibacteraceae bacterium]|nr:nucleoside deaminase [Paludibacteraceae bacterium]